MSDLLFEIGTEELPAGFLNPASEQLQLLFEKKAVEANLPFGNIQTFCTPRRLALVVFDLADKQEDCLEVLVGPSKKAAYDAEGKPTRAAEGFARSKGADVNELKLVETPKGEYLQLEREVNGKETLILLPVILKEIIVELPFAKAMKWGSNYNTFARPIQWILALFGNEVVPFKHDGIVSGMMTKGHRFMAPSAKTISVPSLYEEELTVLSVVADFEKRKAAVLEEIKQVVDTAAFTEKAVVAIDETLLNTVTNLVEKPFGVCGHFDEKFLQLPAEVLITSMREHQKYFPVINQEGSLLAGFVAINNTDVTDYNLTREGHERVLRARLEDGLFFFESDKKKKLENRCEDLAGIIFQNKLGSMKEKSERIVKLSRLLSELLTPEITNDCCRAAHLCKADLITDMVGEFPSLQGVMGSSYAANDGETPCVVTAIKEHYMPVRAGAPLPCSPAGAIVGLADRLDTIAGCFGIGQQPTGTADPFGLRRLSLAILHIIEDRGYTISLTEIFKKALALYGDRVDGSRGTTESIIQFIKNRFANDCVSKGMDSRSVDAVLSVVFDDINDCLNRIEAFSEMRKDASFDVLAGSFKRVRNIVKDNVDVSVDEQLLVENAEKKLWNAYKSLESKITEGLVAKDYLGLLQKMLVLKDPVDLFFDEVMVMADDEKIRKNRLNMLTAIGNLIQTVGDISRMHSN